MGMTHGDDSLTSTGILLTDSIAFVFDLLACFCIWRNRLNFKGRIRRKNIWKFSRKIYGSRVRVRTIFGEVL